MGLFCLTMKYYHVAIHLLLLSLAPKALSAGVSNYIPVNVDPVIERDIERLMVLGNFMLLCEIDPDEVYKWFMELFIDAYDWVMVPNVYGMSQFADGGLMATKPST